MLRWILLFFVTLTQASFGNHHQHSAAAAYCLLFNNNHCTIFGCSPQPSQSNTSSNIQFSIRPYFSNTNSLAYRAQQHNQPNFSSHKYTTRLLETLHITDAAHCIQITHMIPEQIEQLLKQDWPNFTKQLLEDTTLHDEVVWAFFNQYAASKWKFYNQDDIATYSNDVSCVLDSRNKLKAQQNKTDADKKEREQKQQKEAQLKHQELTKLLGCNTASCQTIIDTATKTNQINNQQLLPQVLPELIASKSNQYGLLPIFANSCRATTLDFDKNIIPTDLQVPANYFFATIQSQNIDQVQTFLAQQGLQSIALASDTTEIEHDAFAQHAQQLYQELISNGPQGKLIFETNPGMLQEIQKLETIYQDFYDPQDLDDILSQRYQALQTALQNPTNTNIPAVPANVQGFMQAHGLDQTILFGYEQTIVQQQISSETIQIIEQSLQVNVITPQAMVSRSIRLFQGAVGQISQQTLLYNRLGHIADAFESVDIGWCLVEYGPDMIAGAFDCVVAPAQLAATVLSGASHAIAHPLETLQMMQNGLSIICDGTRTIGHKLYDGAINTAHYTINHNPNDWYDDIGILYKRSIDIMCNVQNQAYDYIKTVDSHNAVRTISSIGCGWYMMPLVQARTGSAVAAFTNSIKGPLLEKATALQTASATLLAKGIQQTKQLGYKVRNNLQQLIKKTDDLIQDLLPQTELAARTPYGEIINISNQSGWIQKTQEQLFLLFETVKNKTTSIIPAFNSNNFAKYNRSDIILPEVIQSSGIRQIEAWREKTNNFKDLKILQDTHRLYLNYVYYLHQELQPLREEFQKLGLTFQHGGRIYQLKDIDLIHVLLGDILPNKRKVTGMHYVSQETLSLYKLIPHPKKSQKPQIVEIFKKNISTQIECSKSSTLFPSTWNTPRCFQKTINALRNAYELKIEPLQGSFALISKTSCGMKIKYIYDPISQTIKTFYPIIETKP